MEKTEKNNDKLMIYGIYIKLIDSIKHFDTIQTYYRTLASSILLATFAAIGFLFTSRGGIIASWPGRGTVLICFLSFLAINVIKILDIKYQEGFLISNFLALLTLERKNPWLPQAHQMMIYKGQHFASSNKKDLFYIGCNMILLILIILTWIHIVGYQPWKICFSLIIGGLLAFLYVKGSLKITKKIDQLIAENLKGE
jgi:hypothetical protein